LAVSFAIRRRIAEAYLAAAPVPCGLVVVRVLVIDNYDSFTYNLVQVLGGLGADPVVHRNDAIGLDTIALLDPDGIVVSPGPGTPDAAGISRAVIETFGARIPVLGVCLGHQCIGEVFGGRVVRAERVMHGKTSWIHHRGVGVLTDLPDPFEATRYHSLVVERTGLPDVLEITAETDDGVIMGLRHRTWPVEGVQFHPESILTVEGPRLLRNFLDGLSRSAEARTARR
jgi:anthranilate synthase/aminodeoxychorismate synthase-like glutamine amidotransferase